MLVSRPGLKHTTRVLLTLVQPVWNMGYELYTDRYDASLLLARELSNLGITLTGTVMANRNDMPLAVRAKGKRKRGDTKTYCKQNMFVMECTDKRTILTLSTKSSNGMVDIPSR